VKIVDIPATNYHQLRDDIIEGGLMMYEAGAIRVPDKPGLGVKLDREKLQK
jgi:glucarate dehydratase